MACEKTCEKISAGMAAVGAAGAALTTALVPFHDDISRLFDTITKTTETTGATFNEEIKKTADYLRNTADSVGGFVGSMLGFGYVSRMYDEQCSHITQSPTCVFYIGVAGALGVTAVCIAYSCISSNKK